MHDSPRSGARARSASTRCLCSSSASFFGAAPGTDSTCASKAALPCARACDGLFLSPPRRSFNGSDGAGLLAILQARQLRSVPALPHRNVAISMRWHPGTKHLAYCRVVWHRARLPPIFHDAPSGPVMWRVSIRAWIARATRFCAWKTHGGAVNSENHLWGSRAAPAGGASWHRSRGVGVFRRPVGWQAITGRRVVSADDGAH